MAQDVPDSCKESKREWMDRAKHTVGTIRFTHWLQYQIKVLIQ